MIKDFRSFLLPQLRNEAAFRVPPPVWGEEKKLSQRGAEQQNKCFSAQVNFWRWHDNMHAWNEERYDSGCNIRNRFGAVSNHLSLSLITFDRAAVRRDIKVDSVTKLPQYGATYEGILCLIFPPSSTFHLHKSTQTITSSHEYKAITDSLRVEIILTLLQRWYNYHANLAHQQFKTLSVIISRIKTPTKRKKKKERERGKKKKRNYARTSSHYNSENDTSYLEQSQRQLLPTIGVE